MGGETAPVVGVYREFGDIELNGVYLGTYNPEDADDTTL